jgi:fructokinase
MAKLLAAVELGGTKALAALGTDPLAPLRRTRIATSDPGTTLGAIETFLAEAEAELGPVAALGIASFGPVHIGRDPRWGRIGRTSKPGWEGADVVTPLQRRLNCPASLDTDVNGAALAEARWGAGRDVGSMAYLTVGTGIGGGLIIDGRPVHGAMHPEIGHVRLSRHADDDYRGRCPFHGDCAEGLASGPAIMERFGKHLGQLAPDHPFRAILADYLGQLCATLLLVASPERIVIGGGVMVAAGLHGQVEDALRRWLGGYMETPERGGGAYIVPPALGDDAGLAGAFALAQDLL